MARCWIGIASVRGWLTGGANKASTTARADSLWRIVLLHSALQPVLSFAEVLFVAQFTSSTNDDYSDALQALQLAICRCRVARQPQLAKLHRGASVEMGRQTFPHTGI